MSSAGRRMAIPSFLRVMPGATVPETLQALCRQKKGGLPVELPFGAAISISFGK